MDAKITYLITGAKRGIGFGLVKELIKRPNTIVLATVRELSNAQDLLALVPIEGSALVALQYNPDIDPTKEAISLKKQLDDKHIKQIDILIANIGTGTSFHPTLSTTPTIIQEHILTNTLGPITLFQTLFPLLSLSANPKFIYISSALGSIAAMEDGSPTLAYGISKAAANYFVRKIHFECTSVGLVSVAVHPGWVRTENGQGFADAVGVEKPPMSVEESVGCVLKVVDGATREETSGKFISHLGTELPW